MNYLFLVQWFYYSPEVNVLGIWNAKSYSMSMLNLTNLFEHILWTVWLMALSCLKDAFFSTPLEFITSSLWWTISC